MIRPCPRRPLGGGCAAACGAGWDAALSCCLALLLPCAAALAPGAGGQAFGLDWEGERDGGGLAGHHAAATERHAGTPAQCSGATVAATASRAAWGGHGDRDHGAAMMPRAA